MNNAVRDLYRLLYSNNSVISVCRNWAKDSSNPTANSVFYKALQVRVSKLSPEKR